MTTLKKRLRQRIEAAGPLSIAEFMEAALGDPVSGYYATRDPFGAEGDFTTAPEISQVFGELIGAWCGDVWDRMGRPERFILAELGPGRGTLMADLLRALRGLPEFGRAASIHLVETSPHLRGLQAQALAGYAPVWHERIDDLPDGPLIAIGNEFLDALPIRQFVRMGAVWLERRVGVSPEGDGPEGDGLAFTLTEGQPMQPRSAPSGAVFEECAAAADIASALGRRVARSGGAVLFIDYGYYPHGFGDTLQAVRRHRPTGVLDEPGEADLTAHVDFSAIAEAARAGGARVWGPAGQGEFLSRLGLGLRLEALLRRAASPSQKEDIASGCRRLIDPAEMGTLFKVLAIAGPALPEPAGFSGET